MRYTVEVDHDLAQQLLGDHRPPGYRSVSVLAPVHAGLSGATVWQVDLQSEGALPGGFAIAKFDDYERLKLEESRTQNARLAPALEQRVPKVLYCSPPFEVADEAGHTHDVGFMLSMYAQHDDAEHIESLQKIIDQHGREDRDRVVDQIEALVEPLFGEWYASAGWTGSRHTQDVPATISRLLAIGGGEDRLTRLDDRLADNFDLTPTAQRLLILDHRPGKPTLDLESPAYVLRRAGLWAGHPLRVAACPMHGDLHGGNVMCQTTRSGRRAADPKIIDFATYEAEGVFFYDLAQLELDILSHFLPDRTLDDWCDWLHLLAFIGAGAVLPEGKPAGDRADHAWELARPIRRFVAEHIASARAANSRPVAGDLERAWWLAVAAVGVRTAQRSKASPGVRSAGLVYAGLALGHLPHEPIPDPTADVVLRWYLGHGLRASPPPAEPAALPEPAPVAMPPQAGSRRLFTPHRYEGRTTFVGRAHELEALDRWAQSDKRVLELVAVGGQGKSALAWRWFNDRAIAAIPDFAGALWWSFYESDGVMSRFLTSALHFLGGRPLADVERMSRQEREDELVSLCRDRPLLFVLDGLERILNAYRTWRAATQTDQEVDVQLAVAETGRREDPRGCYDPQDGALLRRLADAGAARILITSRLAVADLEDALGKTLPGVEPRELAGLADDDVLALFRRYDVTGSEWQIVDFARIFQSHSLLLALIVGRVRTYPPAPGDFDRWHAEEGERLDLRSLDLVSKRDHILRFALEGLSSDARSLLRRLAVYNHPFDFGAAAAVAPFDDRRILPPGVPEPPISRSALARLTAEAEAAEEDWQRAPSGSPEEADADARRDALRHDLAPYRAWESKWGSLAAPARRRALEQDVDRALGELEDRGMIAYDFARKCWDMHPVVRGYAYNELADDPKGRVSAIAGKRNYFESRASTPPDAITHIDDLRRELEIYDALLQAGERDRAASFYIANLDHPLHFVLSTYHEIIRLLAPLCPKGPDQLPDLRSASARGSVLHSLVGAYRRVDLEQCLRLSALNISVGLEEALVRGARAGEPAAYSLVLGIDDFVLCLVDAGRFASALHAIELYRRLVHAGESRSEAAELLNLTADIYAHLGRWVDAEAASSAVDPADFDAKIRIMREGEWKQTAAEVRIARGEDAADLLDEAERLARTARHPHSLRNVAKLRGEAALKVRDGPTAVRHFEHLLEMCQKARISPDDARGALARALLLQGDEKRARAQVDAGADDLSTAEVLLAVGERERAEQAALTAYGRLWGEGAPFADRDLSRAEAVLRALDVPVPALPLFDDSKLHRPPEEDRIIEFIAGLEAERDKKPGEEPRNGSQS